MPYRQMVLQQTLEGYERTGVRLVAAEGSLLKPAGFSDDIGIYELIPQLARMLNLTLPTAIDVFFIGLILVSATAALSGCLRCFKSGWLRIWSTLMVMLVVRLCLRAGDVYVIPACLTIALLPWYLYFFRQERTSRWFVGFALLLGAGVGAGHWTRAHSGTPILLIVLLTLVFCRTRPWSKRLLIAGAIVVGLLLPMAYFSRLVAKRDAYLTTQLAGYEAAPARHPLWHSVYIGLGYRPNDHGIAYRDEVAIARAEELNPGVGYLTPEYEATLRAEVFRIARTDPGLIARTLLAKFKALGSVLLAFANFGLLAAIWRPKGWGVEVGFWLALAFAALSGLLVMPFTSYTLGFIALAAVYGVFGLERLVRDAAGGKLPSRAVAARAPGNRTARAT